MKEWVLSTRLFFAFDIAIIISKLQYGSKQLFFFSLRLRHKFFFRQTK